MGMLLRRHYGEGPNAEPSLEAPEAFDIDKATVAEMRAFASDRGIDIGGVTLKADIRAAIEPALSPRIEGDALDEHAEDDDLAEDRPVNDEQQPEG